MRKSIIPRRLPLGILFRLHFQIPTFKNSPIFPDLALISSAPPPFGFTDNSGMPGGFSVFRKSNLTGKVKNFKLDRQMAIFFLQLKRRALYYLVFKVKERFTDMEDNTVKYTISFKNTFLAVVLILLALAVVTYNPADTAAIEGGTEDAGGITNAIGLTGAWAARFCFYYFGVATYPVLLLLLIGAVRAVFPRKYPRRWYVTGMALVTLSCATLFALNPDFFIQQTSRLGIGHAQAANSALSGGVIGQWLAAPPSEFAREGILRGVIGIMGTLIVGWLVGLAGMVMVIFAVPALVLAS